MSICVSLCHSCSIFFFFNDTATTEIYTLSLHDALPILVRARIPSHAPAPGASVRVEVPVGPATTVVRSEEHTSELQSPCNLVCRLLLEKKKKNRDTRERDRLKRNECTLPEDALGGGAYP